MPHDRSALDVTQRSRLLTFMWLGVPASLLHLLGQFVALAKPLDYMPGPLCAGLLIGGLFKTRHDEFIAAQFDRAGRVAIGVAGLMMLASLPLFGPLLRIDAAMGFAVIAAVFNLAFGWFRLTGERG